MKRKACIIMLVMLLSAIIPTVAGASERIYIKNGDFDNGLNSWSKTWQSGNGTVEVIAEKQDNCVLYFQTDDGKVYLQQNISNLNEGDRLNLSFRYKIENLCIGSSAAITLEFYDTSGGMKNYVAKQEWSTSEINDNKWTYKGVDILVPVGADTIHLLVRLIGGGEVYYDDLEITDFNNKTELIITTGDLELEDIPIGVKNLTAKLHYVPEASPESGHLLFMAYGRIREGVKELLAFKNVPYYASSALYTETNLELPEEASDITVSAYVWKNGQNVIPIAEQVTLHEKAESGVYDHFIVEKMRGAYGGMEEFYKEDVMQKLSASGINTFIFNIIGNFRGGDINKDAKALDAVCQDVERYIEETGNAVFLKASFGANSVVENVTFGAYHPGKEHNLKLPCPLSLDYWEKEMLSRLEVVAKHPKITGVVFDMEMYSGGSTRYPNACLCEKCVRKFVEQCESDESNALSLESAENRLQYLLDKSLYTEYKNWFYEEITMITSLVRERLHSINPELIIGYMPQYEWIGGITRGLGTNEMPVMVFNEQEYKGSISMAHYNIAAAKLKDLPAVYTVGLWSNEDKAIKKSDFASKIVKAGPINMGYWIYSINDIESDPEYYDKIKTGNEKLTEILK